MFMGRKGIIKTNGYIRNTGGHKRKVFDNVGKSKSRRLEIVGRVLVNERGWLRVFFSTIYLP